MSSSRWLADRFALSARAQASKAALLTELEALLEQRRAREETTVLIVDEAQSLPPELLEELRLLANIETDDGQVCLSVIFAGQPELAARLNDPSLRQLKQRIALRCELPSLIVSRDHRVHRRAHQSGRRSGCPGVHARSGHADPRDRRWDSAND